MKLTRKQLQQIIKEEIDQISEMGLAQARVEGPLKNFVGHLNAAKQDLGQVFQQLSDQKASDQAQMLLNGLNKMIQALEHMPELTRDPWHGVGRHD